MNVYVRELAFALSQAGGGSTVFTRRTDEETPMVVDVEPGFRVVHVEAGSHDLSKEELPGIVDDFTAGVASYLALHPEHDGLLANYWLSGVAGHQLKHELDLPLMTIFHTLARVKAETGDLEPRRRIEAETTVVGCSDLMLANSPEERRQLVDLYGADPARIEVVPPGVDHAFFTTGSQAVARRATGLGAGPVLLFAGRIQPLKGVDVAVRTLEALNRPEASLVVVGGASGAEGEVEEQRLKELAVAHGLVDRVHFVAPQPHHSLAYWYRVADVVVMPSRSESFGLVALEAAACGVPVVAADVGGLRTLVDHGRTGYLVEGRDPADYAAAVAFILDDPELAAGMASAAAERSWSYTWSATAARLRRICDDVSSRSLVDCS